MVSQIWPLGHSAPTPTIEYRLQKIQCRDNLTVHQSLLPMLKRTMLYDQIRIEKKILNRVFRDKSRGRVTGLILQVPQTTIIFFFFIHRSEYHQFLLNILMLVIFFLARLKNTGMTKLRQKVKKNSQMSANSLARFQLPCLLGSW